VYTFSAETLSGLSKGCRVDIAPMLPLNASHAHLLAAIAEQIPRTVSSGRKPRSNRNVARLHSRQSRTDELQLDDSSFQTDHGSRPLFELMLVDTKRADL